MVEIRECSNKEIKMFYEAEKGILLLFVLKGSQWYFDPD